MTIKTEAKLTFNIVKISSENLLAFMLIFSMSFVSCAPSKETSMKESMVRLEGNEARIAFEKFEKNLMKVIKNRRGGQIYNKLTQDSKDWIEEKIEDANYADKQQILSQEFHEQFVILAIRHARLAGWINELSPGKMLKILFRRGPVQHAFVNEKRTPVNIEGDEAWQALERSPNVPLYFYNQEWNPDNGVNTWKLNLKKMLPIISRGLQTIAHKQKMDYPEAISFLLKTSTGLDFGEQLFEPLEG